MSKLDLSIFEGLKTLLLAEDMGETQFFYELFDGDYDELGYVYDGDYSTARQEQNKLFDKAKEEYGYEHIEAEGGGEGEGEYCYGVIKFQDKYYKAEWSYYSYHGCDTDYIIDTIKEVTPKKVTTTLYS